MTASVELYRSPNGDCWRLERDPATGHGFVVHEPNAPSGGHVSRIDIGAFLAAGANGPEHQALLRLIGTLATGSPVTSGAGAQALKKNASPWST